MRSRGKRRFVEAYLPVWDEVRRSVIGVVEIYRLPDGLFSAIDQGVRLVWISAALGMAILYAALFWLAARAQGAGKIRDKKIRDEEKIAPFEQLLRRGRERFNAADARPSRQFPHRSREVSGAAFQMALAPQQPDLRPAPVPGTAEGAERRRKIFHEARERTGRSPPAAEAARLLGPGKNLLRYLFRSGTAADESASALPVVGDELAACGHAAATASPWRAIPGSTASASRYSTSSWLPRGAAVYDVRAAIAKAGARPS